MNKRLALFIRFFVILIMTLSCAYPVLADDSSRDGQTITLTINWLEDEAADRPESVQVELYRSVDGKEVPMDSKVITSKDSISKNTWQAVFSYYYGQVWEYAFKINGSEPPTALYSYQMIESGNGTDHYTFDFVYGHGSTTMTIQVAWDPEDQRSHPDSVTIDLMSLSGDGTPERTIVMKGGAEEETWTATVHGLKDSPSNYYIQISSLSPEYTYVVNRGYDPSTYIASVSYDPKAVTESYQQVNTPESLAGSVTEVVHNLGVAQIQQRLNRILIPILVVMLIILGTSLTYYYFSQKHHSKKRRGK